jgi:hypothetical protein
MKIKLIVGLLFMDLLIVKIIILLLLLINLYLLVIIVRYFNLLIITIFSIVSIHIDMVTEGMIIQRWYVLIVQLIIN